MPKDISSPFTPGRPAPVEFFVGREAEINRLRTRVRQCLDGRLQVAFLLGERGIGKSSLASFLRVLCEQELQVLGLHTFLGGVTTLEEMVRRVFDRLLKESVGKQWQDKIKQFFGSHIREVGLFGVSVEFGAPESDLRRLVSDFAPAIRNLVDKIKGDKKGVLLILDDMNGLASSGDFANWLKSVVDEISTSQQPLPLCILLVGIEDRRQSLVALQPSLARVFDLVEIRSWTEQETRDFFTTAFSKVSIKVDDRALEFLSHYVGGLPVLAQEIGDAAFSVDTDNRIDGHDAIVAVWNAAEIVGRKYLEPHVLRYIQSPKYRSILGKVALVAMSQELRRADLLSELAKDEGKVLDNFLSRMVKLGVIERTSEKGPGVYRFTTSLYALYFAMYAQSLKKAALQKLSSHAAD